MARIVRANLSVAYVQSGNLFELASTSGAGDSRLVGNKHKNPATRRQNTLSIIEVCRQGQYNCHDLQVNGRHQQPASGPESLANIALAGWKSCDTIDIPCE